MFVHNMQNGMLAWIRYLTKGFVRSSSAKQVVKRSIAIIVLHPFPNNLLEQNMDRNMVCEIMQESQGINFL